MMDVDGRAVSSLLFFLFFFIFFFFFFFCYRKAIRQKIILFNFTKGRCLFSINRIRSTDDFRR